MDITPVTPALEYLCRVRAQVDLPQSVGRSAEGERRVVPILGGTVSGDRLNGIILPGGADWQLVHGDGMASLEARYVIETGDGARVAVVNSAIRHAAPDVLRRMMAGQPVDPAEYYFRSTPRFQTGAAGYEWLNRTIAVCSGARTADEVILDFYRVT